MTKIKRYTAEKITRSTYPQVVNIPDLRNAKQTLSIHVDERESILLQYYLFFHGWRVCKRKFYNDKPWKLKSTRRSKEFESIACTAIRIRTDGTFLASMSGGLARMDEIDIKFEEIMEIFEKGYSEVEI